MKIHENKGSVKDIVYEIDLKLSLYKGVDMNVTLALNLNCIIGQPFDIIYYGLNQLLTYFLPILRFQEVYRYRTEGAS